MTMKKMEPAGLPVLTMGSADAELDMAGWATELVSCARSQGVELGGDNGLLTAMVRQVLQTGLNVEMVEHLGYEPHAVEGRRSGNNRNGSYPKTVTTDIGQVEVQMCLVTGWARSNRSRSRNTCGVWMV